MKTVNTHQVTQRWAVTTNWPWLLRSLFFCACVGEPRWYSERRWAKRAGEIKCSPRQRILAQQGVKHMWLKWDMSIVRVQKRESCPLCISRLWLQHFNRLSPSGVSLVWCCAAVFRDNCFPCCFYYLWLLCGRSRVGASDHGCTIAGSSTSSWFSTCGWFESLQNLL